MKISHETTYPEVASDYDLLQSFTISELLPSRIATIDGVGAGIHSPYATLVALLEGEGRLMPGGSIVSEGQVILIPPVYPCRIMPENGRPMELAAVDFCFKSHGSDVSAALPQSPTMLIGNSAELIAEDVCIVCSSTADGSDISRTIELLAAGYRMAHLLSVELDWSANPTFSASEDGELQTLTRYLEANYRLPLTIEDIAAECGFSRRKAFEVASRHAFRTPMRLLKQIRLERSLPELRRENASVAQAASAVGFGDARNFAREFKKSYGLTPLQYKQQSQLTMHTESLVNKAESKMEMNLSQPAAELYLQAIDSAPSSTDLNELHYKAGLALKRAGDNGKAKAEWAKVTTLYYRLLIDLDECEYLGKNTDYELIVEKLKRVLDYSDAKLCQKAVAQLGKWMLDCATSQKQRAAKRYSLLAKELVGEYPELQPTLARTLYATGQFEDIERYCPEQPFYIAAAMRTMGLCREHLDRFPEMRMQCALLHLQMGNTEEILANFQDQHGICVKALINAGRAEEAVSRFPEHSAEALMALGRFEDILRQYPDTLDMCTFALANLGRETEALEMAASSADLTSRLLLHLERSHDMTSAPSRGFTVQIVRAATVLQAIHVLERGELGYGMEILGSVQSMADPDYRTGHELYEVDLIVLLIRHVLPEYSRDSVHSQWPSLAGHLCDVVENWRYFYSQRLWYDARFILNHIDEAEFQSQPYRLHVETRLALAKAMKAELNDRRSKAVEHYQAYLDSLPQLSQNYIGGAVPVIKAYIRWRMGVLAG